MLVAQCNDKGPCKEKREAEIKSDDDKAEEREINLKCYTAGLKNTEKGYLPTIAGSFLKLKKTREWDSLGSLQRKHSLANTLTLDFWPPEL